MRNVGLIAVGIVVLAAALYGQGAAAPDATTQALVTELRALRADINRIAGSSIRTQLLATRLQLQEQRILTVSRQIADVQKELAGAAQARAGIEMVVKQSGERQSVGALAQEEEGALGMLKQQLTDLHNREQQLRQQESSLAAMLADEQARWTDFNSRLDDLERALAQPRQ